MTGRKWWTSGAGDPRCTLAIVMGKTDSSAPQHRQQSMILVYPTPPLDPPHPFRPMDAPGVEKVRALTVFGYDDAPHGHPSSLPPPPPSSSSPQVILRSSSTMSGSLLRTSFGVRGVALRSLRSLPPSLPPHPLSGSAWSWSYSSLYARYWPL